MAKYNKERFFYVYTLINTFFFLPIRACTGCHLCYNKFSASDNEILTFCCQPLPAFELYLMEMNAAKKEKKQETDSVRYVQNKYKSLRTMPSQ